MPHKIHYVKFATRPSSVARDEQFIRYMLKAGVTSFITVPIDIHFADYYVERSSYHTHLKNLLDAILKSWRTHLAEYDSKRSELVSAARKTKAAVRENKSRMDICSVYKKYMESAINFCPYIMLPFALKEFIEEKIMKEFPKHFEIITSLDRPTIFHVFQNALLTESIEEIRKKYEWLNIYSLLEKPYTNKEIEKLKKSVKKQEVENIFVVFKENKKKFDKFIAIVKDPKKKAICILMHEYAFLRTDRVDAWKESLYQLIPFFEYLASIISPVCRLEHTIEMSADEIIRLLEKSEKPNIEELEKRAAKEGIFCYAPGSFKFVSDATEKERILKDIEEELEKVPIFIGITACKGHAIGEVKIINNIDDLKNFKAGQILVARSTELRFTNYMQKAAAIITDEGGITSHAAIISRELEIPCVINTEKATKILKDGDVVEVDADNGIVKIIKRSSNK